MLARRCILLFFLLAGGLTARGQDFRTGVPSGEGFLVAGEHLAWLDADGNVLRNRPLERPLTSMAALKGRLYALDAEGLELLVLRADGAVAARKTLPVQGHLRALSTDGSVLWAVTDAGEILHGDGTTWRVLDFNAQYAGYYPRMDFRAVAAGSGSVMVAGLRPDGRPVAFTSARGTVWNERALDYMEDGKAVFFTAVPLSLSHDASQDRFLLVGSGGVLLAIPGCSHCNSLARYPVDTLFARIPADTGALLLGSDGFLRVEKR